MLPTLQGLPVFTPNSLNSSLCWPIPALICFSGLSTLFHRTWLIKKHTSDTCFYPPLLIPPCFQQFSIYSYFLFQPLPLYSGLSLTHLYHCFLPPHPSRLACVYQPLLILNFYNTLLALIFFSGLCIALWRLDSLCLISTELHHAFMSLTTSIKFLHFLQYFKDFFSGLSLTWLRPD